MGWPSGALGGPVGEFKLVLLGKVGELRGGAFGVEALLNGCSVGARSFGLTTSIGRSYGEVYPPLALSTKL